MRFSKGGFSVEWGQYSSVMCAGFQELQQRAEFVDMTIAADGHLVRAHQMVVGLASPFLKEMLRSTPSPHPVLFLNNVSHDVLCCLLEYMYTGEAFVPAELLKDFIATGKALHVRGLEDTMETDSASTVVEQTPEVLEAAAALTRVYDQPAARTKSNSAASDTDEEKFKIDSITTLSNKKATRTDNVLSHKPVSISTTRAVVKRPKDMPDIFATPAKLIKMNDDGTTEVLEEYFSDDGIHDDGTEFKHDAEETTELDEATGDIKSTLDEQGDLLAKPDLMYTISNQGGLQLILNRCLYRVRNKYKDGRRRWECVETRMHCKATVITLDDKLLGRYKMHNHPFHDKKILAKTSKGLVFASLKVAEQKSI